MTITNINSFKPRLELTLNGQEIGCVSSKETVEKAVSLLEQTVSTVLNESYEFSGSISYKLILSKANAYVSASEIYDIMYSSSQCAITSAYGLYIDGELVGAAENESDINQVLSAVLEEIAEKTDGENLEFANDIKIVEDNYAVRDMVTQDELKNIITYSAENAENIQDNPNLEKILFSAYTVDSKQYLYDIADSNIPLSDGSFLADESSVSAEDMAVMAAATSLDLTPESINTIPRGFLESVASSDENNSTGGILTRISKTAGNTAASAIQFKKTKTESYTKTLPFDVKYIESANYYTGTQIIQKNGVNGEEKITADVTYIGDSEVAREILGIEIVKEPVSKVVVIGTKPKPLPGPTGGFIRPVKGGYTTSRFGRGHRGVDLVLPFGSPIYAADGGTVIYAGFSGSYGNHVKIRHNDGFVTLYAHMSSIGVKNGDKVFQGQEIGKVGSTGNSSGNHLHFEIIKNGVLVNPESYMK
jgi:murein DD-endopeptidase MepM/ murein hydrolase activator NlpD